MQRFLGLALIVMVLALPRGLAAQTPASGASEESLTMTMEMQKSLARRSLEMWSSRTQDDPAQIFAPNYANHQEPLAAGGVSTIDLAAWEAVVAANHRAFPDLTVAVLMQVGEGDVVATHWRFTATQTGPYEELAPTGRPVSWTGMQMDRFENGRIAETWVSWDKFTMFQQLGLIEQTQ